MGGEGEARVSGVKGADLVSVLAGSAIGTAAGEAGAAAAVVVLVVLVLVGAVETGEASGVAAAAAADLTGDLKSISAPVAGLTKLNFFLGGVGAAGLGGGE